MTKITVDKEQHSTEGQIIREVCNECGRSVRLGSGWFVNRVPDLNEPEVRKEMGKPFPEGDFICAECENKRGK